MPVPDFSPGEVLTAAAMDSIGLWKTASGSATSGTVLSIQNCFSADYEAYKVVITRGVHTADAAIGVQLANGGTPNTTNYAWVYTSDNYSSGSTYSRIGTTGDNKWTPVVIVTPNGGGATFDIQNPFLARRTIIQGDRTDPRTTGASGRFNGFHDESVSFSGLYFTPSGGTYSAFNVCVYGYRL